MDTPTEEPKAQTIAEAENTRGSAEPNKVAPIEETVPATETVAAEIVNMPDVLVTANSEPKIIETEPESIVEETLVESTPATPETSPTEEIKVKPEDTVDEAQKTIDETVTPEETPDIISVRTEETGDKVYAVKDKKRYWIKNPETLAKMGFYLGKEKRIPFSELLQYSEGEPIDLTVPNAAYPWDKPEQPKTDEPTSPSSIWQ